MLAGVDELYPMDFHKYDILLTKVFFCHTSNLFSFTEKLNKEQLSTFQPCKNKWARLERKDPGETFKKLLM